MDKIENKPLVAIHCLVYNHEPYLRDCFEGFVMQQTDFPFVAIVHDDASTDGSAAIIREYEEKYPHIFKPIYETENQYSKRDGSLERIMNEAIDGTGAKYVAVCEGDDYWIDSLKLQKQVDFLENNKDFGLVHTNVYHLVGNSLLNDSIMRENSSFQNLILGNKISTLTVMVRTEVLFKGYKILHDNPELNSIFMGDYPLYMIIASITKVQWLNNYSGVYRIIENSVSHSINIKERYLFDLEIIRLQKVFYRYAKSYPFKFCDTLYDIRVKTNLFHAYKRLFKRYKLLNTEILIHLACYIPIAILYKLLRLN